MTSVLAAEQIRSSCRIIPGPQTIFKLRSSPVYEAAATPRRRLQHRESFRNHKCPRLSEQSLGTARRSGAYSSAVAYQCSHGRQPSMTFLAVCFFLYFAPAVVATSRQHPDATTIWFVNFFFGWTGIGWFICLVWTLSVPRPIVPYPFTRYAAPLDLPGCPPLWRSADGRQESVCLACYRPLQDSSNFCTMCGAMTHRSA